MLFQRRVVTSPIRQEALVFLSCLADTTSIIVYQYITVIMVDECFTKTSTSHIQSIYYCSRLTTCCPRTDLPQQDE